MRPMLNDKKDNYELFAMRKIGLRCITQPIDTTSPGGRLVFTIFAAMAEFERDLIRERTNAGLKAAVARDGKGGRLPPFPANKCHDPHFTANPRPVREGRGCAAQHHRADALPLLPRRKRCALEEGCVMRSFSGHRGLGENRRSHREPRMSGRRRGIRFSGS